MGPKAQGADLLGRFREVVSDPNNLRIKRVETAGFIFNDDKTNEQYVVMHNGLKVLLGKAAYYGQFASILGINRGVHEPQEEYAFEKVLDALEAYHRKSGEPVAPMLELGAYWSFYSMCFKTRFPNSQTYMVEPKQENLAAGRRNFSLNELEGEFLQGKIETGGFSVTEFLASRDINRLTMLHADIQGSEHILMEDIQPLLNAKAIAFLFISTHSQDHHSYCLDQLNAAHYQIVTQADFDNDTFCYDGLIVASAEHGFVEPFDIYSRGRGDRIEAF